MKFLLPKNLFLHNRYVSQPLEEAPRQELSQADHTPRERTARTVAGAGESM